MGRLVGDEEGCDVVGVELGLRVGGVVVGVAVGVRVGTTLDDVVTMDVALPKMLVVELPNERSVCVFSSISSAPESTRATRFPGSALLEE